MTVLSISPDAPVSVAGAQSGMFMPPGRPRPLARRLAIHNLVVRRIRHFLEENGFQEIPVPGSQPSLYLASMLDKGFPAVWCESQVTGKADPGSTNVLPRFKLMTVMSTSCDLEELCALMESLIKDVTMTLGADLLGGRHVTRLDRTLQGPHPRLTHVQAVAAAGIRGWDVALEDDLTPAIEATLVRHCGNLPVLVTHWPAGLKPGFVESEKGISARVKCILPYAGEVMDGGLYDGDSPGKPPRAGFGLGVGRLLQYLMGLGSITDTVIVPESGSGLSSAQATE